jgi:hypothetical protein
MNAVARADFDDLIAVPLRQQHRIEETAYFCVYGANDILITAGPGKLIVSVGGRSGVREFKR